MALMARVEKRRNPLHYTEYLDADEDEISGLFVSVFRIIVSPEGGLHLYAG